MKSKKELSEIKGYKNYPEGSVYKEIYDSVLLSFEAYLKKYYSDPDLKSWRLWQNKYVQFAFDKSRQSELVERFGYASIDKHDFEAQYHVYDQLKADYRLDEETRRFIGFMAGNSFFKIHKIDVLDWFAMLNWANPNRENGERTINEILSNPFGLNMLKSNLPHLDHWRR